MIWVRKTEEECGNYVDAEGKHYVLEWCHKFYGTLTAEDMGYARFESVEAAAASWGLTPYEEPIPTEETTLTEPTNTHNHD